MNRMKASYLASLIDYPDAQRFSHILIDDIVIDSRDAAVHTMFVALKGMNTDGHHFIRDAVARGTSLILASLEHREEVEAVILGREAKALFVTSPLRALQQMAQAHMDRYPSVTRVGITGSCGKTTTKEMVSSILSLDGPAAKNPGNFNSEIGVALSAFNVNDQTRYGVFEMGIDHIGEMSTMVQIIRPDVSLITNIGLSHVGKLGAVAMTAKEKGRIFHRDVKQAFMAESSRWAREISQKQRVKISPYGLANSPNVRDITSMGLDGWRFTYRGVPVNLRAIGRHNLSDALAAIAVGESLGIEPRMITEGLSRFIPVDGRSKVSYGSVTLIEDWYNSSPDSTRSILECIDTLALRGKTRIVLGSMKEMGVYSQQAHEAVSRRLVHSKNASIYLYGNEMKDAFDYLKRHRGPENLFITEEYDRLQEQILGDTKKGDLVLLKGSRAMQMERLVPAIHTIR
ncbi:MAG: UDP-N-acetylmuramoyl-tripeptide--D-alanyl-D-alanine ligase [Sphaerochaetaceae bacterium]|nr:UDP-N-acetylmuramoyl-tripeptide--D-alanyl-D-alanine ligase [Sphaerochaetaceae bacterium]